ncbi:hypothetical protein ACFC5Z_40270 [Streptomyces sp. NPDC056004]|uniref:hypothetical protein n=1 Tax=Streptomyces sp. NPDC056004 TaxID=3345677 RepID=UPI0035E316E9
MDGDLLGGDRDPLEHHLGAGGRRERDDVLGEQEQMLTTWVVVTQVSPGLPECALGLSAAQERSRAL